MLLCGTGTVPSRLMEFLSQQGCDRGITVDVHAATWGLDRGPLPDPTTIES